MHNIKLPTGAVVKTASLNFILPAGRSLNLSLRFYFSYYTRFCKLLKIKQGQIYFFKNNSDPVFLVDSKKNTLAAMPIFADRYSPEAVRSSFD